MRKRFILVSALCAMTMFSYAQKVDFDMSNRQPKEVTEDGYQSWAVSQALADTARIGINETDSFTVIINAGPEGTVNRMLRPQWNKALVTDARKARLVGDAVAVLGDDGDGNTPELVSESATINLVLKEMSAGHHTMLAYMNCVRNKQGETAPIDVLVDGKTVLTGVKMTCDAETPSAAGQAYIEFDVAEGKDVTISFVSKPEAGVEYLTTGIYLNGLVFDQPNPKTTALDPTPANADLHFNADEGSTELTWTAAAIAPTATHTRAKRGRSVPAVTLSPERRATAVTPSADAAALFTTSLRLKTTLKAQTTPSPEHSVTASGK